MKKLLAFIILASFALPILVGCSEQKAETLDSSKATQVDSTKPGKKNAVESSNGVSN